MFFGTVSLRLYKLIYMQDKRFYNALPEDYKLHWYVIKNVLGRGGFGITYLAIDTNLDRKVAIKEFYPVISVIAMIRTRLIPWKLIVNLNMTGAWNGLFPKRKPWPSLSTQISFGL